MEEKLKKHWYNNGTDEKCLFESEKPEGWVNGRLPISEETRKKHSENNGMKHLTEEQKQLHSQHLHEYNQNKTEEQKQHKSEAISKAKKGKYKGSIPWNKGMKGFQTAWNKGIKKTEEEKQKLSETLQNLSLEKKAAKAHKLHEALKGRKPWNRGIKTGAWSEEKKQIILAKRNRTRAERKNFNTSEPENDLEILLKIKYDLPNDVIRHYSDSRYPYECDFYIKSLDLFIELNECWTHGDHPYDPDNAEDRQLLAEWNEKSKTSEYYANAIYTWTDLDSRKQKLAKDNNLNYITLYNESEMEKFILDGQYDYK